MNIDQPSSRFITLPGMKRRDTPTPGKNELRLPGIGFLPNKARNHFVAFLGEFIGTFLFLFFAFAGTQVANQAVAAVTSGTQVHPGGKLSQVPNAPGLLYIALAFGFSLAVNVWVFFRISGGKWHSKKGVTGGLDTDGDVQQAYSTLQSPLLWRWSERSRGLAPDSRSSQRCSVPCPRQLLYMHSSLGHSMLQPRLASAHL